MEDDLQFIEDGLVQEDFLDESVLFELLSFGHDGLEGLDDFLFNDLVIPSDWVDNFGDLLVEEGLSVVLEVVDVELALQQVLDDAFQVDLGSLVGGCELGWDLLSDNSEWVDFGLTGQDIQDVAVVHVLLVVLVAEETEDLWVGDLGVVLVDGVEQVVDVVVDLFVEHVVVVEPVGGGGGDDLTTSIDGVDGVDGVVQSTEDFWDGHSADSIVLSVVLAVVLSVDGCVLTVVLSIDWCVLALMLELHDDGEDVLVEEDWVNKEVLEDDLGPVLLEGGTDNVLLEGGHGQELTEEWDVVVLLEQGKSVQLTEGVDEDVGGQVDLLGRWLDQPGCNILTDGQVSVDCLLQFLDVVVQGGGGGYSDSTSVDLSHWVLLTHWVLLSLVQTIVLTVDVLAIDLTVLQVVNDVLVYSSCHLSAHSGNQHNCNESLHDEIESLVVRDN